MQPRPASAALSLCISAFALRALTLGTVEPLLVLCLALTWRWRDRPLRSGGALAAGVLIKPVVAPLALFFLITRRPRTVAMAIPLCALSWFASPGGTVAAGWDYLRMLRRLSTIEGPTSLATVNLVGAPGVAPWVSSAALLAAGAALMLVLARRSGGDRSLFAVAVALCLIVSPIVWSQYFLLIALAVAILRPGGWLLSLGLFAASWFIAPDRRWPFSPSAPLPPSTRLSHWLAQLLLVTVLLTAAIPALIDRHESASARAGGAGVA